MRNETFNRLPDHVRAFVTKLTLGGIPLAQIDTNDFHCNTRPSVYITIPYGMPKGGKSKRISANYLNKRTLKSALKFYKK